MALHTSALTPHGPAMRHRGSQSFSAVLFSKYDIVANCFNSYMVYHVAHTEILIHCYFGGLLFIIYMILDPNHLQIDGLKDSCLHVDRGHVKGG